MMNWNSVGIKVALTTTAVLAGLSLISLYFYAQSEKQQIIASEVHTAKNQLMLSEAVRDKVIKTWEQGIFSPQMILNIAKTNSGQDRKEKILATVPIANA